MESSFCSKSFSRESTLVSKDSKYILTDKRISLLMPCLAHCPYYPNLCSPIYLRSSIYGPRASFSPHMHCIGARSLTNSQGGVAKPLPQVPLCHAINMHGDPTTSPNKWGNREAWGVVSYVLPFSGSTETEWDALLSAWGQRQLRALRRHDFVPGD